MKNRSRLDILRDILVVCYTPKIITHIQYICNLSWENTVEYLNLMLAQGLVEIQTDQQHKYYSTTMKGRQVVEKSEALLSLVVVR